MNKNTKVLLVILLTIIILWFTIFLIDYIRCSNFKEPIFVIPYETADDGGSGIYYGLGYKVKTEKYISAKYGAQLIKVEMYMFDRFLTGAIADIVSDDKTTNSENSFIATVLEETTTYMIVEPNKDEEERKSSDKIVINYGTDHIDYVYGKGRKVKIYYYGYIMETYPAQINTDKIETLD